MSTWFNFRPRAGASLGPFLFTALAKRGRVRTHVYARSGRLTWRIK